ncbi:hypothetical protein H9Q10_01295 [Eikenella sp. S3360]|uniref:Factor H binding protein-like C-terminal domain-containing protein n=1 Tax=Eikenella glucosivorans TaxID=2766967 RepID=A0ABS0N7M9_9NEIS|nr:factor H binding protein domain-containing protein [Eikenella glucosivorans]MBH5328309.1 hypothetical protein [Eikenella glucosivorans]
MKKHHLLYIMLTAFSLGGCGAGGGLARAVTDPFTPKPHGKATVTVDNSARNGILHANGQTADTIDINGRTYRNGNNLDISYNFQNRLSDFSYVLKADNGTRAIEDGKLGVYKRAYTAVVGAQIEHRYDNAGHQLAPQLNEFRIRSIQGEVTPVAQLPNTGIINYQGHAFSGLDDRRTNGEPQGRLNYNINFGNRTGSGSITGLHGFGNINLREGNLDPGVGIRGTADSASKGSGHYELNVYGPNGAEIAGKAYNFTGDQNHDIGFAGSRTN